VFDTGRSLLNKRWCVPAPQRAAKRPRYSAS
jgi:hypothetical protein